MIDPNQWAMPSKVTGITTPNATFRIDPIYTQALALLAKRESERLGVRISQATLLTNLTTQDANFFRTKRSELREIIKQLNKENNHVKRAKRTQEEVAATFQ